MVCFGNDTGSVTVDLILLCSFVTIISLYYSIE